MIGFSVSSGKVSRASMRFFTSSNDRDASASSNNSTWTEQRPSFAVERICLTPSIPSSSSSMRMHTPCSTSSGAAPRYGTVTVITLTSMSGNDFCGIPGTATSPANTMRSRSRLAATWFFANQAIGPFICGQPVTLRWRPAGAPTYHQGHSRAMRCKRVRLTSAHLEHRPGRLRF